VYTCIKTRVGVEPSV